MIAREMVGGGLDANKARSIGGFADSITAAGNSQGTATILTSSVNTVTGADGTKGVILPASAVGDEYWVFNSASSGLNVYPDSGAAIAVPGTGSGTTDAAVTLGPQAVTIYKRVSGTQWYPASNLAAYPAGKAWTPNDASGASLSFTGAAGEYITIGNMVLAWGVLTYPATANGANAKLGGLPLTCANTEQARGGVTIGFKTESTLAGALITNNSTTINLYDGSGNHITNATMSGDQIYFLATYPIS